MAWRRLDSYSAQTDGFYTFAQASQADLPVNEYATELCGSKVKGNPVLVVYVVWKEGKRCIADMPRAWPDMLKTCVKRRKARDDIRKAHRLYVASDPFPQMYLKMFFPDARDARTIFGYLLLEPIFGHRITTLTLG